MSDKIVLKHDYTEIGYCQCHYKIKTKLGNTDHYCLQDEGTYVEFYSCSEDGEADHPLKLKSNVKLEVPGDVYGKELLTRYNKRRFDDVKTPK